MPERSAPDEERLNTREATLDEAIDQAIEEALERRELTSSAYAQVPYFSARRLGATAAHDCSHWRVDFRAGRDAREPSDLRRIDDNDIVDQLNLLNAAGLRAKLPQ